MNRFAKSMTESERKILEAASLTRNVFAGTGADSCVEKGWLARVGKELVRITPYGKTALFFARHPEADPDENGGE